MPLQSLWISVMPAFLTASRINAAPLRRKNILPGPITISTGIFARQRLLQVHTTKTGIEITRVQSAHTYEMLAQGQ